MPDRQAGRLRHLGGRRDGLDADPEPPRLRAPRPGRARPDPGRHPPLQQRRRRAAAPDPRPARRGPEPRRHRQGARARGRGRSAAGGMRPAARRVERAHDHGGLGAARPPCCSPSAFGGYRAYADGRFRGTHPVQGAVADGADGSAPSPTGVGRRACIGPDVALGERATLLQFSSAFCAPCRATRRTLADVAASCPASPTSRSTPSTTSTLVRRLGILRTPTTLVLDADGVRGRPRRGGAHARSRCSPQLGAVA